MAPERESLSSSLRSVLAAGLFLLGAAEARAQCTYSLSPAGVAIPNSGGSGLINVTAPAGCTWLPTSGAPWISTMGSGSGNGSVGYWVGANAAGPRSGSISIGGQTFTINQAAAPCTYGLSPTSASVPSAGGSGLVTVTTGGWCSWLSTSQAPWITTMGGGAGSASASYSVAPNPAGIPRSGSITVAGQTFTVNQAAAPCTYAISPTSAAVGSGGSGGSLGVTAPAGCSWTAASQASWITLNTSGGSGSGSVGYSVAANPAGVARSGSVTVAGQTFTVSQAAAPCTYSLSPTGASLGGGGGDGSLGVSAPVGCSWQATSQASWISLSGTGGSGNGSLGYSVAVNTTGVARSGSIAVAGQTFTVTQASCTYGIAPGSASFDSNGGGGAIGVTATAGCPWQAASQAPWVNLGASGGSGDGSVGYSVAVNPAGVPRSGSVVIAGHTFTVSQGPAPCTYSVAPTLAQAPAAGASGTLTVTAPAGCPWAASSPDAWISAPTTGSGSGTAAYSVAANPAYDDRMGTIEVAGQGVTVSQDATMPPYIDPPEPVNGPVLERRGNRFTVDGQRRFLLFVSYYDALRVDPEKLPADLAYFKSHGIDGIRILPNWFHASCGGNTPADDDGLFLRIGAIRPGAWAAFVNVLREAADKGLLVDVTFTHETITGLQVDRYRNQIADVARLLAGSYRHVLFDLQNEHDVPDGRFLSEDQVLSIANAVKLRDPLRLITVSTGGGASFGAGQSARTADLHLVATHPRRSTDSWYSLELQNSVNEANAGQGGPIRPVYLQEPMPFSQVVDGGTSCATPHDANEEHHRNAAAAAKAAGAAAYTFHTRSGFILANSSYQDRLAGLGDAGDAEKRALESLRGSADEARFPEDRLVAIQAWRNSYVAAESPGATSENDSVVTANRESIGSWETFELHDLNGGALMSGDLVTFRTTVPNFDNVRVYLQADGNGEAPDARLMAIGPQEAAWETFVMIKPGGGEVHSGDGVFLKLLERDLYWMADEGGYPRDGEGEPDPSNPYLVRVNSDRTQTWETFRIIFQ